MKKISPTCLLFYIKAPSTKIGGNMKFLILTIITVLLCACNDETPNYGQIDGAKAQSAFVDSDGDYVNDAQDNAVGVVNYPAPKLSLKKMILTSTSDDGRAVKIEVDAQTEESISYQYLHQLFEAKLYGLKIDENALNFQAISYLDKLEQIEVIQSTLDENAEIWNIEFEFSADFNHFSSMKNANNLEFEMYMADTEGRIEFIDKSILSIKSQSQTTHLDIFSVKKFEKSYLNLHGIRKEQLIKLLKAPLLFKLREGDFQIGDRDLTLADFKINDIDTIHFVQLMNGEVIRGYLRNMNDKTSLEILQNLNNEIKMFGTSTVASIGKETIDYSLEKESDLEDKEAFQNFLHLSNFLSDNIFSRNKNSSSLFAVVSSKSQMYGGNFSFTNKHTGKADHFNKGIVDLGVNIEIQNFASKQIALKISNPVLAQIADIPRYGAYKICFETPREGGGSRGSLDDGKDFSNYAMATKSMGSRIPASLACSWRQCTYARTDIQSWAKQRIDFINEEYFKIHIEYIDAHGEKSQEVLIPKVRYYDDYLYLEFDANSEHRFETGLAKLSIVPNFKPEQISLHLTRIHDCGRGPNNADTGTYLKNNVVNYDYELYY